MYYFVVCSVVVVCVLSGTSAVTISNVVPRRDVDGKLLEAADGVLRKFGDTYYLYGCKYQCCKLSSNDTFTCPPCAWANTTFAVYSSPDLERWTLESANIFPAMSNGSSPLPNSKTAYFEPTVLYNARTKKYVLWYLTTLPVRGHRLGVAQSDNPIGPFEVVSWYLENMGPTSDCYSWQDDQGRGFLKMNNRNAPYGQYVVELSSDYLRPARRSNTFGAEFGFQEGGAVFNRGDRWYAMGGNHSCMGPAGGGAKVYVAKAPLGPYEFVNDVVTWNASANAYSTHAQQFGAIKLDQRNGKLPVYLYIGIKWWSSPVHELCSTQQYWGPLHFDENGVVQPLSFVDEFELDI